MKVLTVRDPWATAIAEYGKSPENRSWRTHYRGPLGIHCGLGFDPAGARDPRVIRARLDALEDEGVPVDYKRDALEAWAAKSGLPASHFTARRTLLGVAQLVGVHHANECRDAAGLCSPWAMNGMWHWVLTDFRPLPVPIPLKGRQGLWTPDKTIADVLERLADAPSTAKT